jgi:hypothetical protein
VRLAAARARDLRPGMRRHLRVDGKVTSPERLSTVSFNRASCTSLRPDP